IQTWKSPGRDPQNRHGSVVQPNRFSHNRRVATECPLPVAVCKDRHGWSAWRVVGRNERPTERGTDAKRVKKISGDHLAMRKTRRAVASQVESNVAAEPGNIGKRVLERLKLVEHRIRKRAAMFRARVGRRAGTCLPGACIQRAGHVAVSSLGVWRMEGGPLEDNQLLRIAHRQRAKKSCVNKAEDGGVGADAESKSKNSGDSEGRRFMELAEGEAAIGED